MNAEQFNAQAGSNHKQLVPRFVGAAFLMAVIFLLLPVWPALKMTDGSITMLLPMRQSELFAIQYIHSANRSPVIDTLEWGGAGLLIIRSSLFQTYGAGIPADGDRPGASTVITPEGILYKDIDTPREAIMLITGVIADHHILYRNTHIQLKSIFGEARPIWLSAVKTSIIHLLYYSIT